MKKELLLLISASLFSYAVCAQQSHSVFSKRQNRLERVKQQRETTQKAVNAEETKIKSKVNNALVSYKLEQMRQAVERANVNLLDEVVVEGQEKRTYTYSPEGKRDEVAYYYWENNAWKWDEHGSLKYNYQYDVEGRCTKRSIYTGVTETERVEITYNNGEIFYKYYNSEDTDGDGQPELVLSHEDGVDAQGRNLLSKNYYNGQLRDWNERKFDEEGNVIFELYRSNWEGGSGGNKTETTTEGLTNTRNSYNWSHDAQAWIPSYQEITETNQAGRVLSNESIRYTEEGNIMEKTRETYTYDAYNRMTSSIYEEAEGGSPYVYMDKEEYTYAGNEYYPEGDNMGFEGPLLTYTYSEWNNNAWAQTEKITITRDGNGAPLTAAITEYDSREINDHYVAVREESQGTFDSKGNLTHMDTKVYRLDNGQLCDTEKSDMQYDEQNRQILYQGYRLSGAEWILTDEEGTEYNSQGEEILTWYRYKREGEDRWDGMKYTTNYNGTITERTTYYINPDSGEFMTHPSYRSVNEVLPNNGYRSIDYMYDGDGNIAEGYMRENRNENVKELYPNPEDYIDGIFTNSGARPQMSVYYQANYRWQDGDWAVEYRNGFYYEGDNLICIAQNGPYIMQKEVYSFDSEGRVISLRVYQEGGEMLVGESTYEYNSDGLLSKKVDNGRVTTYKYSGHEVTGLEKNTATAAFTINGHIVSAENNTAILKAYSISGALVASGTGTITLPENGIYILVTDGVRQKIVIR